MNSQLFSISKIFTEKLYRIPDYQRGYAWGIKQLKDFWNDIIQLEIDKNHYVGVLTLEIVPPTKWQNWEEDKWIIESKSFEPYYIVDGQQRLTTTIILIQAITELIKENEKLNYLTVEKIKEKFIFDTKDSGISRSYIFGYEKDNPSYEFLKRKIFLEDAAGYRDEETIYTRNLEKAKAYFIDNLSQLSKSDIEIVFKKITQHLLFNIYAISSDIDVFVAFETMNYRGKPLSNLELLKNRLIYLSTKFDADASEKTQLRRTINDSWKAVYHYLGKNKDRPLNDDAFLINHFIVTFGPQIKDRTDGKYSRVGRYSAYNEVYDMYLLDEKFTLKNIKSPPDGNRLTIKEVYGYTERLQESVKVWYNIFNPTECKDFDDEEKLYLDKLYRLGPDEYASLLLAFYLHKPNKRIRIKFLKFLEKYVFLSSLSYRVAYEIDFKEMAVQLASEEKPKFESALRVFESTMSNLQSTKEFLDSIIYKFKNDGFYKWKDIKYFLFEYELSLKEKSKTKRDKINWRQYSVEHDEYITVEHIYPQNPKDAEWTKAFNYHHKRNEKLCNCLGNLLPLSKPKNSSLQNVPFSKKIENDKNKVGYRYGSYSENEITKFEKWTPENVLQRGLHLLKFMEKRWDINLGDEIKKTEILGLSFMIDKNIPLQRQIID